LKKTLDWPYQTSTLASTDPSRPQPLSKGISQIDSLWIAAEN